MTPLRRVSTYIIHVDTDGSACGTDLVRDLEDVEAGATAQVDDDFALEAKVSDSATFTGWVVLASFNPAITSGLPQLRPRFASLGMLARSSSVYPKDAAIIDAYFPCPVPLDMALYRSLTAR